MKPDDLVWKLSISFGLFACSSAALIGLGLGSIQFPMLVGFCVLASIAFTDTLGWVVLSKYTAYLAMIAGASLAVHQYLQAGESPQLVSVASLLIYVQLPLLFQKKSQQVFEQLSVFLLLELVVAALVNDHVLYGVLLVPCLALGCSSLLLFASYVSSLKSGQRRMESSSRWAILSKWLGREASSSQLADEGVVVRLPEVRKSARTSAGLHSNEEAIEPKTKSLKGFQSHAANRVHDSWRTQSLPILIALLFFATCHFFLIPRLHSGAYQGGLTRGASVGFSGSITLGQMGELIQNEAPAMRVSFRNRQSGMHVEPNRPPYLRGIVLGQYLIGDEQGRWRPVDGDLVFLQPTASIPNREDLADSFLSGADDLIVEIQEVASIGTSTICIPPMYSVDRSTPFHFMQNNLSLLDVRRPPESHRQYAFGTLGYHHGQDDHFLPEYEDLVKFDDSRPLSADPLTPGDRATLTQFDPIRFSHLIAFRDKLLNRTGLSQANRVDQAIGLESQMATSGELTYTLNLNMNRDRSLDPIEDFILNQKSGHCQYFASALAIMLRSFEVPTRIVVGFRPSEYNRFGHYFLVRQSHAHAWVEAFFTRQQFDESSIELPLRYSRGAWLRLDATPAGEGSNAGVPLRGSSLPSFDFAQQLWKNYILDMDRSKQGEAFDIFGETSRNAYRVYWNQIDKLTRRFRTDTPSNDSVSRDAWFAWKSALVVFLVSIASLFFWRSFPRIIPNLFRHSSIASRRIASNADYQEDFFRRSMQSIQTLGWNRLKHQTPGEFLKTVADDFASRRLVDGSPPDLNLLSSVYYRIRYGQGPGVLPGEMKPIDETVKLLEQMAKNNPHRS